MGIRKSALPPPSYAGTKVEIKNDLLPSLKVFAKVIEEWKEDGIGNIFQVECEATNRDCKILPEFYIEMLPSDCVQSIWNMEKIKEGVYKLLGYWTESGGLESMDTMHWGMLLTTCTPTITIKPSFEEPTKADQNAAAPPHLTKAEA